MRGAERLKTGKRLLIRSSHVKLKPMLKLSKEVLKAMSKDAIIDYVLMLQAELDRLGARGARPAGPLLVEPSPPKDGTWRAGGGGGWGGGGG